MKVYEKGTLWHSAFLMWNFHHDFRKGCCLEATSAAAQKPAGIEEEIRSLMQLGSRLTRSQRVFLPNLRQAKRGTEKESTWQMENGEMQVRGAKFGVKVSHASWVKCVVLHFFM